MRLSYKYRAALGILLMITGLVWGLSKDDTINLTFSFVLILIGSAVFARSSYGR